MEKKIVSASDLVMAEYAILALLKRIDKIAIGVGSTDYLSLCIQENGGERYYSVNNRYYEEDKDKPIKITEMGGKMV